MPDHKITNITRRDIFGLLGKGFRIPGRLYPVTVKYHGIIDEIDFLKRLYNLAEMPSYDPRFSNAEGDIWQHTVNNDDWDPGWVFKDSRFQLSDGPDEVLLNFLCEIFHPYVRNEHSYWATLLVLINKLLSPDGYTLFEADHISGRPVYRWKKVNDSNPVVVKQSDDIKSFFESDYVDTQIDSMMSQIEKAPHSAIGKAKELIETCCKTILQEKNLSYSSDLDVNSLMGLACDALGLSPKSVNPAHRANEISRRILGNLVNISQGMAELRNLYGDGHGKDKDFKPLPARYARLAVGASVAAVDFLVATYKDKNQI